MSTSTAYDTISCALEKFEAQPADGHLYGYHRLIDGQHCYCLVGAVSSCAAGNSLEWNIGSLERQGDDGLEVIKALYAALPPSYRKQYERTVEVPITTRDYALAVEDYNDGTFLRTPARGRAKATCLNVLRRAKAVLANA